jgi:hypothetical protein
MMDTDFGSMASPTSVRSGGFGSNSGNHSLGGASPLDESVHMRSVQPATPTPGAASAGGNAGVCLLVRLAWRLLSDSLRETLLRGSAGAALGLHDSNNSSSNNSNSSYSSRSNGLVEVRM